MSRKRTEDNYINSIIPPTYRSASYFFKDNQEVVDGLHTKERSLGRYGRYNNPTWEHVEDRLSVLSGAEKSLIFTSGMAAHITAFLSILKSGDHVVYPSESYRQIRNVFQVIMPKFGVICHELSIVDPEKFIQGLQDFEHDIALLHLEMPSSPHMYVTDLVKVRETVGDDVIITMDSSFSPPPNFYPLKWGVNLAIFSATKYLSGQGDIMAGVVSGDQDLLEKIQWYRDTTGGIADGEVAFLLNRSLNTLEMRMEKVNAMGLEVATFLDRHEKVAKVFYTGLESHPHYELAGKYLNGHGAVITFELDLSEADTSKLIEYMKLPYMASNFGAPQTLVEQSTFFTYYEYTEDQLVDIGVPRGTVRLALGYVDGAAAIIEDLTQALNRIEVRPGHGSNGHAAHAPDKEKAIGAPVA